MTRSVYPAIVSTSESQLRKQTVLGNGLLARFRCLESPQSDLDWLSELAITPPCDVTPPCGGLRGGLRASQIVQCFFLECCTSSKLNILFVEF